MPHAVANDSVSRESGLASLHRNPGILARRTPGTTFVLSIAVILVFAVSNFFTQDDGFITLRYAQNLALGFGPVWDLHSTGFGYTNFLFMALAAGLSVVLVPISENCALTSCYLTPHPRITAHIADGSLLRWPRDSESSHAPGPPLDSARLLKHPFRISNK